MPLTRRQFLQATAAGAALCAGGCITSVDHVNLLYPIYLQADLADAALAAAKAAGAQDASVRMVRCRAITVLATGRGSVRVREQNAFGAGVRVWLDGREGFASGVDLNSARIAALARRAVACAHSVARSHAMPVPVTRAAPTVWSTPVEEDPFPVLLERRIADCMAMQTQALAVPGIERAASSVTFLREDRYVAHASGATIKQTWVRGQSALHVATDDVELRAARPFSGGYEVLRAGGLLDSATPLAEQAVQARGARAADAGEIDVVLGAAAVGAVLRASVTQPLRAADCVTIIADRTQRHGLAAIGFDDAGEGASTWDVVRSGVPIAGAVDHGCALGVGFWDPVLPSMPNLFLEPSQKSASRDDLMAATRHGLAIDAVGAIHAVAGLGLVISVPLAREIRDGKPACYVRDVTLVTDASRLWQSCQGVGGVSEIEWHAAEIDADALALERHAASTACPPARFARVTVVSGTELCHA